MHKFAVLLICLAYDKGSGRRVKTSRQFEISDITAFIPSAALLHAGNEKYYSTRSHSVRRSYPQKLDNRLRSSPRLVTLAEEDVGVDAEGVDLRRQRLESALAAFGLDADRLRMPCYAETDALPLYESFIKPKNISALAIMEVPGREQNIAGNILYEVRKVDAAAASYLRNDDYNRSPEELARVEKPRHPIALVLDDLQDGSDVGHMFRLAECAMLEQVVLCGTTPAPPNGTVLKTAQETADIVPHRKEKDVLHCVRQLREQGYEVWAAGAENGAADSLSFAAVSALKKGEEGDVAGVQRKPLALVLGNDQLGVRQSLRDACDHSIFVPTFGVENNLNMPIHASVIVYDVLRQWGSLESLKQ
mmetsp:Transcript_5312/g.9437  ORF Transcript_5312/g.9437 Transcript_5312/m.9437 type:complete len:362 (-) Transcript_5312:307-1392(-)